MCEKTHPEKEDSSIQQEEKRQLDETSFKEMYLRERERETIKENAGRPYFISYYCYLLNLEWFPILLCI